MQRTFEIQPHVLSLGFNNAGEKPFALTETRQKVPKNSLHENTTFKHALACCIRGLARQSSHERYVSGGKQAVACVFSVVVRSYKLFSRCRSIVSMSKSEKSFLRYPGIVEYVLGS
jgi:hypothetical protein